MPATLKRKREVVGEHGVKGIKNRANQDIHTDKIHVASVDPSNGSGNESDEDDDQDEADNVHNSNEHTRHDSKLPSASELRAINESLNLYKNNTFRFQLDALLSKVRPKKPYIPPLERALQKLYMHLTSLPSIAPTNPFSAVETLRIFYSKDMKGHSSVTIPYPSPKPSESTAWKVAFEPPVVMNVVGSWPDELAVRKPDGAPFGVDIAVEMPASLFQEKDNRNSRVFHKRAFYLACLAASLSQSFDAHYETVDDDVRRTCLLVTSRKDGSEQDFTKLHAAIRIIPVLPDSTPIPLRRLTPSQANIRGGIPSTQNIVEQLDPPTPLYNNTLALSFARASRTHLLGSHKLVGAAPSFKEGLALLKVWANQRGFVAGAISAQESSGSKGTNNYCVRGFEGLGAWWACVLEILIYGEEPVDVHGTGKKGSKMQLVGKGLSSYQLFRAALDFFAKRNFETEPVFMRVVERGQKYDPMEWTAHHDAVFVDSSGMINMLAGVPIGSLELLRLDAKTTLQVLDTNPDPFDYVFLTDMREPHARFDTVISIDVSPLRLQTTVDFPSGQAATLHTLFATVRKALNTRAYAVVPLQSRSVPRRLDLSRPAPITTLTLGIIYDPAHATRLVDHGPLASTPEVEAFRSFWGAKAELRRFKDGRILESCVWDDNVTCMEDREGIPGRIVCYILDFHFGLATENVHIIAEDYGRVLAQPTVRGRGPAAYKAALSAFEKLSKELKTLEDEGDVPLVLVATKPSSPSLRYTSVFPPSPILSMSRSSHPSTAYLPAFDIVLQLERSSQWPDDLRAIQKVKLALFESMARGLMRRNGATCCASIVIDDRASEIEDGCVLEVVLDGWAFHAHIAHDREVTLLQTLTTTSKQSINPAERHAAERALRIHRRRFVHAPAHHNAILALSHKFPSFAYTVRLVKRWLSAHWLSARISEEAVELLCARVYFSEDIPATGKRGFVRVVEFLKTWSGAIYIPLYEVVKDNKTPQEGQLEAGQGRWRLMTAEDSSGTVWVEDVTVAVAARVRSLARATFEYFSTGGRISFLLLFNHPTTDYDFIIELDPQVVSRYWHSIGASPSVWTVHGYTNLRKDDDEKTVRVEYSPPEMFFRDLRIVYGEIAELFYDIHGGTSIGGVWNPSIAGSEQYAWRVFLGFSSLPVVLEGAQKGKPNVSFNREGVLAEMERMGDGLVKKITVRD